MVEDFLRQSPLAHLGLATHARAELAADDGVALAERPFRTVITLRGSGGEGAFAAAVEQASGLKLPQEVGAVSGEAEGRQLLCLGPDEWWLCDGDSDAESLLAALEDPLAGQFASAVDTSDNWFALEISGAHAADLLAKACPLDLHPRSFPAGRCARSLLSKAPMTLQKLNESPRFRIHVRRSFADYAWRWLSDAGREYGVSVLSA
ncbi:sarcosine oxidase subunit gamma [Aquibaculum sediminis]|uniref:sarcosine oxidase subunit gamma n=1 Tax=Aquibaculum sediminis TaxID=3231907 RepID=UPI00345420DF